MFCECVYNDFHGTQKQKTRELKEFELFLYRCNFITEKDHSDYVNNTAAVSKIIEAGTSADGNGYLYPDAGQNFMEFFLPLADGLDASMVTAEDQQILSLMDTQTKAYATGEKDLDTAIADLTASIHDTFSYLSAE